MINPFIILSVFSVLFLGGCGKKTGAFTNKPIPKDPAPTATPLPAPNNPSSVPLPETKATPNTPALPATETPKLGSDKITYLKTQLIEMPNPNQYQIQLNWDQVSNNLMFLERSSDLEKTLFSLAPMTQIYLDTTVQAGHKYMYRIYQPQNNTIQEISRAEIEVPVDTFIDVQTEISKPIRGYHRLFLGKNAILIHGAQTLDIQVDQLISDGATIQSFLTQSAVALGQNAPHGGLIKIRTKKASGTLAIRASGLKGGNGLQGISGSKGQKGERGQNADARWKPSVVEAEQNNPTLKSTMDSFRKTLPMIHEQWKIWVDCTNKDRIHGGSGFSGTQGNTGLAGGTGGNSSPIYIEISESSLKLDIENQSGPGGLSGEGGNGGEGGDGGDAGDPDAHLVCSQPRKGSPGVAGPKGQNGPQGNSGQTSPACVIMNSQISGQCEFFGRIDK